MNSKTVATLTVVSTHGAPCVDKRCIDCGSHDWLVDTPAGYVCQPCLEERKPSAILTLLVAVAQVADSTNVRYLVCCEGCERYVPVEQTPVGAYCEDCLKGDVLIFDHDPVDGQRPYRRVCDDCRSIDLFHLFINTPEGCFCEPCLEERNGEPLPF